MLWFESKLVKLPLKINNFSNFRGRLSVGSSGGNWYPEQGASEARATCWAATSSNVQDFASRQDVLQSRLRQRVRLLRRLLKSGELTNPWIGGPTVASAIDMRQK